MFKRDLSWKALQQKVEKLFDDEGYNFYKNAKMDRERIRDLSKDNKVRFDARTILQGGLDKKRNIFLQEGLEGYTRDLVFLHELVHLYYGEALDDGGIDGNSLRSANNFYVVEFLARMERADPATLCTAVEAFGLRPMVYDAASVIAFPEFARAQERWSYLQRGVYMDDC